MGLMFEVSRLRDSMEPESSPCIALDSGSSEGSKMCCDMLPQISRLRPDTDEFAQEMALVFLVRAEDPAIGCAVDGESYGKLHTI